MSEIYDGDGKAGGRRWKIPRPIYICSPTTKNDIGGRWKILPTRLFLVSHGISIAAAGLCGALDEENARAVALVLLTPVAWPVVVALIIH